MICCLFSRSLPSWERGLKYAVVLHNLPYQLVAPLVGAERLYMLIYVLFKNNRYICNENTCYFLIDYNYAGMVWNFIPADLEEMKCSLVHFFVLYLQNFKRYKISM